MAAWSPLRWRLRTRTLGTEDHTLIMGVLNVTPDSFSDGGRFFGDAAAEAVAAIAHGAAMWEQGADLIDVGGESTRPGAAEVSAVEEIARVLPVVSGLVKQGIVVSVDTSKPAVAAAALEAGAEAINDVTALRDPAMVEVCRETGAGVVLMHMQGEPRTMQRDPHYGNVVAEVGGMLRDRAAAVEAAGVARDHISIDPGIGFGKTRAHNLALLAGLDELVAAGYPVVLGTSRKSTLGAILEQAGHPAPPESRDAATGATLALGIQAGAAVLRVHNVAAAVQVGRVTDAIVRASLDNDDEGA
jgi:dihydropteroate synthase